MKTIGIIGGIGPEATMEYYAYMFEKVRERVEASGDFGYVPEIIIYSLGREQFHGSAFGQPDKPAKVKAVIEKLHRAGADFVIGACNALHITYDELADDVPIPWISIMDATAEEIKKAGMTKVGLLGALLTMTHGFYHRALAKHGIETITPDPEAMQKIDDIISTELIWNVMTEESKQYVLGCIEELVRRGAQGVILGCTELPLLIKQKDTHIRVFPTTTIHAQKALDYAMAD
jgi:aspartate racemase